jgi:hypothetical protein
MGIFNEGVVIKAGPAAIVLTPVAGETIPVGQSAIGLIHGGIDPLEPFNENSKTGGIQMTYLQWDIHNL